MVTYGYYVVVLVLILLAAGSTWGETHKTIMYGIAIAGLTGLVILKALEKNQLKNRKD